MEARKKRLKSLAPSKWTVEKRQIIRGRNGNSYTGPVFPNAPLLYYWVDSSGFAHNHPPDGYKHPEDQQIFIYQKHLLGSKSKKRKRKSSKKRHSKKRHSKKSKK